jgi:hypothetical protein
MGGKPDGAPALSVSRLSRWAALGAFTVFLLTGLVTRLPGDAALAISGVLIAFAISIPIFLAHPRFPLLYAGIATVGVVMLGNADSRDIGWFAILVLAGLVRTTAVKIENRYAQVTGHFHAQSGTCPASLPSWICRFDPGHPLHRKPLHSKVSRASRAIRRS